MSLMLSHTGPIPISLIRRRNPLMHVRPIGAARRVSNSIDSMQGIVRLTLSGGTAPLAHQTERRLLGFTSAVSICTPPRDLLAASAIDQNSKKHPWRRVTEDGGILSRQP